MVNAHSLITGFLLNRIPELIMAHLTEYLGDAITGTGNQNGGEESSNIGKPDEDNSGKENNSENLSPGPDTFEEKDEGNNKNPKKRIQVSGNNQNGNEELESGERIRNHIFSCNIVELLNDFTVNCYLGNDELGNKKDFLNEENKQDVLNAPMFGKHFFTDNSEQGKKFE
jgi:hypothetical protein